jgi:hypothetical protein
LAEYRQPGAEHPELAPIDVDIYLEWLAVAQLEAKATVSGPTTPHLAYSLSDGEKLLHESYPIDFLSQQPLADKPWDSLHSQV